MLLTLYEIESVKVPIEDQNYQAYSYAEVKKTKLYIAINKDYYIQLRIQELRMCKQIRYIYIIVKNYFWLNTKLNIDLQIIILKTELLDCFRQAFIQPQLNLIRSENNLTLLQFILILRTSEHML